MKHLQLLVIGVCLGWLIGMSQSAVISSVITSLLSVIVILLTTLSGIEDKSSETNVAAKTTLLRKIALNKVSSVPIMLMLLGIVIGSALGIYCRTHDLLSPQNPTPTYCEQVHSTPNEYGVNIDAMVEKYRKHGVPDSVIVNRILEIELPRDAKEFSTKSPIGIRLSNSITEDAKSKSNNNNSTVTTQVPEHKKSVLFSLSSEKCASLCGYEGKDFLTRLKGYSYNNDEIRELMDTYSSDPKELIRYVKKECKCGN